MRLAQVNQVFSNQRVMHYVGLWGRVFQGAYVFSHDDTLAMRKVVLDISGNEEW